MYIKHLGKKTSDHFHSLRFRILKRTPFQSEEMRHSLLKTKICDAGFIKYLPLVARSARPAKQRVCVRIATIIEKAGIRGYVQMTRIHKSGTLCNILRPQTHRSFVRAELSESLRISEANRKRWPHCSLLCLNERSCDAKSWSNPL